jgi:capsular polysaccharide transport system permease protein
MDVQQDHTRRPGHAPPLAPRAAASAPWRTFLRVQNALILREIATRYGRTPGGFLPGRAGTGGAVLVLTAALSMVVHAPSLGTSFVVFYASGYLPFLFLRDAAGPCAAGADLLSPVLVYPSVSWIDAIAGRFSSTR